MVNVDYSSLSKWDFANTVVFAAVPIGETGYIYCLVRL